MAGEMRYLTDHRADLRAHPEELLPGVKSLISVGLLYNGPQPRSTEFSEPERAWISRYAWGEDYHGLMRARMKNLALKLSQINEFRWRACVDTAPLLERSWARQAGLGWIGKNTCLISQQVGSWFFLGELLTTLELEPDSPPPDRCGTCTRCIDACPTAALTPYELDARLCISYFTIELRGAIPEPQRAAMGANVFGCDICQDVCPWNRFSVLNREPGFTPHPDLLNLNKKDWQDITADVFAKVFKNSAVKRTKFSGLKRNILFLNQPTEPMGRI